MRMLMVYCLAVVAALVHEIWTFMAAALRLTASAGIEKTGRDKVA